MDQESISITSFTQHGKGNCGHVCIAMITGIPPQEIVEHYNHHEGLSKRHLVDILEDLNVTYKVQKFNRVCSDNIYILTVPSLNNKGGHHYIILDTRKEPYQVYDPLEGSETQDYYHDWEELKSWADTIKVTLPFFSSEIDKENRNNG